MNNKPTKRRSQYSRSTKHKRPMIKTRPQVMALTKLPLQDVTYIVFDIETTGGNPERNGITEICALKVKNGEVQDRFYSLVNPQRSIPPIVRDMTGITNKMVRKAPKISEVMPLFLDFLEDHVLVSHNTIGDMKFLRYFADKSCSINLDNFFLCTHLLIEKLYPQAPDKSLRGLGDFFKLSHVTLHRADADAELTLGLFKQLLLPLCAQKLRLGDAIRLQGDLESGMRLGWELPPSAFNNLSSKPGVFYFKNRQQKTIFLASALHLAREVKKLRQFDQLPRGLLRTVLHAKSFEYVSCDSGFAALLQEAEDLAKFSINYDPHSWHQRVIQAITFKPLKKHTWKVQIGAIEADTTAAFGPVRDRKAWSECLGKVAQLFQTTFTKSGMTISQKQADLLQQALEGTLDLNQHSLAATSNFKNMLLSKLLFWKQPQSEYFESSESVAQLIHLIQDQPRLSSLLHTDGALLVSLSPGPERKSPEKKPLERTPKEKSAKEQNADGSNVNEQTTNSAPARQLRPHPAHPTTDIYLVSNGLPYFLERQEDLPPSAWNSDSLRQHLYDSLQSHRKHSANNGKQGKLNEQQVAVINATLWWIWHQRYHSTFVPSHELAPT